MQFLSGVDYRDAKVTANYAQMVLYGYKCRTIYGAAYDTAKDC